METTITRSPEPLTAACDVQHLDFEKGEILLVNKPLDWSSFDVVHRVRDLFHVTKVGHAGTLDPKATGLLIVCTGRQTKMIWRFSDQEKEYEGVMRLGAKTDSFDSETPEREGGDYSTITEGQIRDVFKGFIGTQTQTPPMYSAVKRRGTPLYKFARKGRTLVREAREILISRFEVTKVDLPDVHFRIVCSKGTYVRALVDDCGSRLGCGAYLRELRRTRIGTLSLDQAFDIKALHALGDRFNARHGE